MHTDHNFCAARHFSENYRSYTVRFALCSSISVTSKWLRISCALKSSQNLNANIYLKNRKDLGMACHTPPLKKVKKQGDMSLPSLGPIPSLNSTEIPLSLYVQSSVGLSLHLGVLLVITIFLVTGTVKCVVVQTLLLLI